MCVCVMCVCVCVCVCVYVCSVSYYVEDVVCKDSVSGSPIVCELIGRICQV